MSPLSGKLTIEPSIRGLDTASMGITVYGWRPDGSLLLLARGDRRAVVEGTALRRYLAEWRLWGLKHGLDVSDFQPPILVLFAALTRSGELVLDARAFTLDAQLLLRRDVAAAAVVPMTKHWVYKLSEYPPERIDVNWRCYLELQSSEIYWDQHLPLVAVYLHGPDKNVVDWITELLILTADRRSNLHVDFNIMGLSYHVGRYGSIEKEGYIVVGPAWRLTSDKASLNMELDVSFEKPSAVPSYCRWVGRALYCFYSADEKAPTVTMFGPGGVDYLAAIGLEVDVAVARYITVCSQGNGGEQYVSIPYYVNMTMTRPLIVHDGVSGETYLAGWAELAPYSMLGRSKTFTPFTRIARSWRYVKLGWATGNRHVSSYTLAERLDTLDILSAGVGLSLKMLDIGLLGVSIGMSSQSESFNIASASFLLKQPYSTDGRCKLLIGAYRSPVLYYIDGRSYPAALMYIDAYADINGCRP